MALGCNVRNVRLLNGNKKKILILKLFLCQSFSHTPVLPKMGLEIKALMNNTLQLIAR